jgi:uncharacterized membrane protein
MNFKKKKKKKKTHELFFFFLLESLYLFSQQMVFMIGFNLRYTYYKIRDFQNLKLLGACLGVVLFLTFFFFFFFEFMFGMSFTPNSKFSTQVKIK